MQCHVVGHPWWGQAPQAHCGERDARDVDAGGCGWEPQLEELASGRWRGQSVVAVVGEVQNMLNLQATHHAR